MAEITFIVDTLRGALLVEDNRDLSAAAIEHLEKHSGAGQGIGCARPLEMIQPPIVSAEEIAEGVSSVRIAGLYHDSLTEGPGRRSSVLFQYCPLKCKNCWTPELHSKEAGALIPVKELADLLLNPKYERDGVSILGGEPFAQADGLLALIKELRLKGCSHVVCYSGYTIEVLREKSTTQPSIAEILNDIDVLIDGPFIESLASGAGLWTGSGNQRVIDLPKSKRRGEIVIFGEK